MVLALCTLECHLVFKNTLSSFQNQVCSFLELGGYASARAKNFLFFFVKRGGVGCNFGRTFKFLTVQFNFKKGVIYGKLKELFNGKKKFKRQ